MFLRFVTARSVDGMRSREGFFQAAGDLVHDPLFDPLVVSRVDDLRMWFSANLDRPDRFSKSTTKKQYYRDTKGLSWFKPSADAHISKAFELMAILEENGHLIELLKAKRLGYVVYEDEYQIVAEPFSDTRT